MKGRYASVSMRAEKAILPGVTHLARLPAEPTETAACRLKVMEWHEGHGNKVRFATRHYGSSPDTISRWAKAYAAGRVPNLEPSNRWPKHVRQPTTPPEVMVRIQGVTGAIPKMVDVEATGTSEP